MTQPQQWTGVGRTETGHVRASNQDALALLNDYGVWIVADGMSGHPAGDLAAQTAVAAATVRARERAAWLRAHQNAGAEFVADLVTNANQRVHDVILAKPFLKGMGTTFVALVMTPASMPVAHIAHLGDSRAYLYRAGQLQQLTRDHT
ncbi:MAG: protein phosphatase 2C domain-containing protein, partial [Nitrospirota bacterium]|nr:protein phosphatase 2C domain-containing protein [Nitrospirota bacterium]